MKIDLELLDLFAELEGIVKNASSLPFSQKCTVDRDEILAVISDIKALIPEEINQAVWINKERNKLKNEAKQEASSIVEQANKEADRIKREYSAEVENMKKDSEQAVKAYVESSEPMKKAEAHARDLVEKSETVAHEIRLGAIEYAEDVLSSVEYNLKNMLEEIVENKKELRPKK